MRPATPELVRELVQAIADQLGRGPVDAGVLEAYAKPLAGLDIDAMAVAAPDWVRAHRDADRLPRISEMAGWAGASTDGGVSGDRSTGSIPKKAPPQTRRDTQYAAARELMKAVLGAASPWEKARLLRAHVDEWREPEPWTAMADAEERRARALGIAPPAERAA